MNKTKPDFAASELSAVLDDGDSNRTGFRAELEALINRHSKENCSDTPDFILADYMADCLDAYNKAVTRRSEWYRPEPKESTNADGKRPA